MGSERLIVGTAQLGMDYGVANNTGLPGHDTARSIIETALINGIRSFDTAQAYGTSEQVLARILEELEVQGEVEVFTKLHPEIDCTSGIDIQRFVHKSAALLGQAWHCCMLHREQLLDFWDEGFAEHLLYWKQQGMFRTIGISVYDPAAALAAIDKQGIDYIQLPANALDRRHEQAGVIDRARKKKKTIVLRSIYLQGALLLAPQNLPPHLHHVCPYVAQLTQLAHKHDVTVREMLLLFAIRRWPECYMVVGVELPEQLQQTVETLDRALTDELFHELDESFEDVPLSVIRPDLW